MMSWWLNKMSTLPQKVHIMLVKCAFWSSKRACAYHDQDVFNYSSSPNPVLLIKVVAGGVGGAFQSIPVGIRWDRNRDGIHFSRISRILNHAPLIWLTRGRKKWLTLTELTVVKCAIIRADVVSAAEAIKRFAEWTNWDTAAAWMWTGLVGWMRRESRTKPSPRLSQLIRPLWLWCRL